jgi:hypothetical protein
VKYLVSVFVRIYQCPFEGPHDICVVIGPKSRWRDWQGRGKRMCGPGRFTVSLYAVAQFVHLWKYLNV